MGTGPPQAAPLSLRTDAGGGGWVLLGPHSRCMTGVGVAGGSPLRVVWTGLPSLPKVTISTSLAPWQGASVAPAPLSPPRSAPLQPPAPTRVSVFASSRYVPVCRRAEEVV